MEAITQLGVGDAESKVTNYFAALLHVGASLILALLVPTFVRLVRDVAAEHAPGLTAVAGGMLESFFTVRFGIFFLVFFSVFHLARRSAKPGLRICLFWIPACVVTALGFSVWVTIVLVMRMLPPS